MNVDEPNRDSGSGPPKRPTLPFASWKPIATGALYGLLMRTLFSSDVIAGSEGADVMTNAFVVFVPIVVGALTVYFAHTQRPRTVSYYVFAPWLSVALFVAGTAAALIEGAICIALALPLFMALGSVGGLLMGLICRLLKRPARGLQSIAFLPLAAALAESGHTLPQRTELIERSAQIQATPAQVWQHINYPLNIQPHELEGGLAYRIGVPYPVEARTITPAVGGKRALRWQRGVSFEEIITAWDENRHIAWRYVFTEDSFPPGSMDEHVVLGGRYFDLEHTAYSLTPTDAGTRLDIAVRVRVSTQFNWYARPVARFLIGDTADAILGFYKRRSEATARAGG